MSHPVVPIRSSLFLSIFHSPPQTTILTLRSSVLCVLPILTLFSPSKLEPHSHEASCYYCLYSYYFKGSSRTANKNKIIIMNNIITSTTFPGRKFNRSLKSSRFFFSNTCVYFSCSKRVQNFRRLRKLCVNPRRINFTLGRNLPN